MQLDAKVTNLAQLTRELLAILLLVMIICQVTLPVDVIIFGALASLPPLTLIRCQQCAKREKGCREALGNTGLVTSRAFSPIS